LSLLELEPKGTKLPNCVNPLHLMKTKLSGDLARSSGYILHPSKLCWLLY